MTTASQNIMKSRLDIDLTPAQVLQYGKAVKVIAAADGLSEKEQRAIEARLNMLGVPEDDRKEILGFDVRGANLKDMLKDFPARWAKAVLYSALAIAGMDGLTESERASVMTAAELLGVDANVVRALEQLTELERS